jgi:hypothetical protein
VLAVWFNFTANRFRTSKGYSTHAIRLERGTKPPIKELIVLSPQNDPLYAGTDSERTMAEWFAELVERFDYTTGVYLRRIHYRLVSEGSIRRTDGSEESPFPSPPASW